jgi:uncharacterized membrane protein
MPSSLRGRSLYLIVALAGIAYPFLVYFGLRIVSPAVLAGGLVVLLGARVLFDRGDDARRRLGSVFFIAAIAALILVALSPLAGLESYPILVSLALAGLFAYSLWRPPPVIERIARISHPDLPPAAVPYLRKVTLVWLGFFLANAAVSAATAVSGNMELWMLYNGFISYILMGTLFVAELVVRQRVRRSHRRAGEA